MINNNNLKYSGTIHYWNGIYGFIVPESGSSIFFHISQVLYECRTKISLMCEVEFSITKINQGKHKGKKNAIAIEWKADCNLIKYPKRIVGVLEEWNEFAKTDFSIGKNRRPSKVKYCKGLIKSPQQTTKVRFNSSQILNKGDVFKPNDLVVFFQVKSIKNNNNFFALFAYPIEKENDITYLQQAFQDSRIEGIKVYIDKLLRENTYTEKQIIDFGLKEIEFVDNQAKFEKLIFKINEFRQKSYNIPYEVLEKHCKDIYLIQLWELEIISEYKIELIEKYFHTINVDKKVIIIHKLTNFDKKRVLTFHFENLKSEGKLQNNFNSLKTLLDITYRNKSSRILDLFIEIKSFVLNVLTPIELIELLANGYLDDLPEKLIVDNFDIVEPYSDKVIRNNQNGKLIEVIQKIYEDYFLNLSGENFNYEFPKITKRLINFANNFEPRYEMLANALCTKFSDLQKYVLWIFNVKIEFNAQAFLKNNHKDINIFFKIKFFLSKKINKKDPIINQLLNEISFNWDDIQKYANSNPWNSLIHPTEIIPSNDSDCYFLKDIEKFQKEYKFEEFDVDVLGLSLFDSLPKYQIHHLRLWLYNYVNDQMYDYVGFREGFKFLTSDEQAIFKSKGDITLYNEEVIKTELYEVVPCTSISHKKEYSTVYLAKIENLYFGNGSFQIRKEDNKYSRPKLELYASSGFNRIPASSGLNEIEITIEVNNKNEIVYEFGLKEIFTLIHTAEIERALGKVGEIGDKSTKRKNKSYIEDWKLRKDVIEYLNSKQFVGVEPKSVFEPKNNFRHLDVNSGITSKDLTKLFSIETSNGFGIVWENIDLTEDRATYVFKCSKESHKSQIEKIANSIATLAQFRSTLGTKILKKSMDNERLELFKSNLGLIGSIRKQRGKNESFENWLNKLNSFLIQSVPLIPSSDKLDLIKNWSPNISHHPSSVAKFKKTNYQNPNPINPDEITQTKLFDDDDGIIIPDSDEIEYGKYDRLFEALMKFNHKLSEIV